MENTKTQQSIDIVNSIQESVKTGEAFLSKEETISLENYLTNIKLSLKKIKDLEDEVTKYINNVKEILVKGKDRVKNQK